jgi:uncharacterized membrane protein
MMTALTFLVLVVILLVLLSMKSTMTEKLNELDHRLDDMKKDFQKLSEKEMPGRKPETKAEVLAQKSAAPIRQPEPPPAPKPAEVKKEPVSSPVPAPEPTRISKPVETPKPVEARPAPPVVFTPRKKSFFENNPDLEKFIGENLANKIGIAILVLGIGFFVKYAIDQNWINEIGRVFIGIVAAGILLGLAHRLRKTFTGFSSVLVGGGIAVLYFTIAIAFHEYKLFSQTAAFTIMVVITGFTIFLSLGYNRIELAVLGILGGFASPFMVSTGEGNYIVLFTYLLILNCGMLVLAYYKKWRIINIICYFFTIIIFGGWLGNRFDNTNPGMIGGAIVFSTLFYLVFFLMNIINNIKQRAKFEAMEIIMLLSNTFLYFSAGMTVLDNSIGQKYQGLFTALLAVFNFIFAYSLYRNKNVDRNLVYMLIGLVLTFVSLAAPIQLEGNYITLFWAAEAVVLFWLYQKSQIRLMQIASFMVILLMCGSLVIDWKQIYLEGETALSIILNKGYVTSIVAIISLTLLNLLLRREKTNTHFDVGTARTTLTVATVSFFYLANLLELLHQVGIYVDENSTSTIIVGCYNAIFILAILLAVDKLNLPEELRQYVPGFGLIAMGSYLFFYHKAVIDAREVYLENAANSAGFIFHYILVMLVVLNAIISFMRINEHKGLTQSIANSHWWIFIVFFLFIASSELDHTVVMMAYTTPDSTSEILRQNHKIGYPILWGVSSFLLIAFGLRKKLKVLRIISLFLMGITLLKLFLVDLKGISEGGKIAAFISLGILLLVVSFMYQRLKKLLLEDTSAKPDETL